MTSLLALSSQVRLYLSQLHLLLLIPKSIDSEKSTSQMFGDSTRGTADSAQNEGKTMYQSAQETAGNIAGAAADNIKAASEYSKSSILPNTYLQDFR